MTCPWMSLNSTYLCIFQQKTAIIVTHFYTFHTNFFTQLLSDLFHVYFVRQEKCSMQSFLLFRESGFPNTI